MKVLYFSQHFFCFMFFGKMYFINYLTVLILFIKYRPYLNYETNYIDPSFEIKKNHGLIDSMDMIKIFENIRMDKIICLAECFKLKCTLVILIKNEICSLYRFNVLNNINNYLSYNLDSNVYIRNCILF